ncbi:MAG: CAP domain-containing protein [Acidimicrobiia bacterium]
MSSTLRHQHRRTHRWATVLIAATILAVPSLPVLGAVLDPGAPMVASARSAADRSPSSVVVGSVPADEATVLAAEVVRLANLQRVAAGRPPLTVHPAVTNAAMGHSLDQAAMQRMSHIGSDGADGGDRLTRAGFTWGAWGENVAVGQRTPDAVVRAWMDSAGHRANILQDMFTTIGVGVATDADGTRYWTMMLAL